ncbi:NAD-dependent epimerase/dehydratase family protein [Microvirga makkahensis]|uniref:NAD-dependent epimerase/dehydratase family protein n=1 Tax=Microvirga makkahensis TaxID=1128670 RepID=A0A7X3MRJ2_9HYPH|nr:NAD-dependent epimerase/dehydratase family protein [Microvirga makkahensis]MXQ11937.1 NAD-dependent epimerase/dehydratase family protein [Microvirga makkahensis]
MNAPLIALTGSTGFIGRHILRELPKRGYRVRVLLRRPSEVPEGASSAVIGDIASPQNMAAALRDVDMVIHSAGLAHAMSGRPEDDYRAINTQGTIRLAQAAERAGVKRFVFLSSIRAQSGPVADGVLTEDMEPRPTDAYGRSKLEAEQGLAELGLDWAALRPVLVYGPGVKGNMAMLLKLARSPWPLPLGGLKARRSLLSLDNLTGALDTLLKASAPLRRPFIAADPEPVTVPEIVTALRKGLGRAPGLVPVPSFALGAAAALTGKGDAYERLSGSLVASPEALKSLGWQPVTGTPDGLARLARLTADSAAGA